MKKTVEAMLDWLVEDKETKEVCGILTQEEIETWQKEAHAGGWWLRVVNYYERDEHWFTSIALDEIAVEGIVKLVSKIGR